MSNQRLLREERPAGGESVPAQDGGWSRCLWTALCTGVVLGLLAGTTYLMLQKFSLLDGSVDGGRVEGASAGPPRLMNMIGRAPQRVTVHLTAIPNSHRRMRLSWRKQGGTLTEGVDLRDNALVINIPGLYFVYTQVTFYNSSCPDNLSFLSHNIQRLSTSYRGRQTLLSSMDSACQGNHPSDTWFVASYHGAAFKLAKGDQIFSVVSPGAMAYVNSDAEKTYFGLFALSRSPPS